MIDGLKMDTKEIGLLFESIRRDKILKHAVLSYTYKVDKKKVPIETKGTGVDHGA